MQSRSILFLVIVAVMAGLSGWLVASKKVAYGLDVQGGVRLVYQMDKATMTRGQLDNLARIQADLVRILTSRADVLGVAEPLVAKKGDDSFVIELPGYTDIEAARETISTTAKVIVYWAKTVSTELSPNRRYQKTQTGKELSGVTYETFVRSLDPSKVIEPGTPEYKDMIGTWDPILEGEEVSDAQVMVVGNGARPQFFFNDQGARKLEAFSRRYLNKKENIAFVLDNKVLNMAPIKDGAILSTEAIIEGSFPVSYVKNLTELVKAGSLPVELKPLSSETVDPTIGKEALNQMITAGLISLSIVCVLTIFYYRFPGVIAALAMLLYTLFTLAFLIGIGATFSLAAIAAIILSIGMAVDANILVFERLKEELREGKELRKATSIAFNRALKAIVDSNISTVITCAVLFAFGTGPVKGFATTLAVGVAISFVTAFLVTRVLIQGAHALGLGTNPAKFTSWYGLGSNWFKEHQVEDETHKLLNIIGRAKTYFIVSAALIIPGLIFVAMGGIKPNVEFQGGFEGTYKLPQGKTLAQIREGLESKGIHGSNIKFATTGNDRIVYLTVPPMKDMSVADDAANAKIAGAAGLSTEGSSFTAIGPTVQEETVRNAISGVVLSSIFIMLYLGFRFGITVGGIKNGLKFGASAVIALVHDVLFVVGCAGILGYFLGWEISALFITAMLTVIGFSVHDTIIIFDRVRENLQRPHKGETFAHLCDKSVTQSVARSINTTISAVIPLGVLLFIGTPTPELKFMCLAMLLGISIGAYSSIFNATPILYYWDKAVMKKKGEQAGLMAESAREVKLRAQAAAAAPVASAPGYTAPTGPSSAPKGDGQYGQIKRRSTAVDKSKQILDDDE